VRPNPKPQYIFCPACHLGDYWIVYSETLGRTEVVCQGCGAPFIQINYVPAETPDPSVII
jgi:hypothetical protein